MVYHKVKCKCTDSIRIILIETFYIKTENDDKMIKKKQKNTQTVWSNVKH